MAAVGCARPPLRGLLSVELLGTVWNLWVLFAGAILARYESSCQYNDMMSIQVTDHTTGPTNPARATGRTELKGIR